MFHLMSVEAKPVTKELAEYIANLKSVKEERPLTNTRMLHLDREIAANTLRTFNWATAEVAGEPGVWRVNGQTSSSIFASGRREPVGTAVIEHYVCDTENDVVSLWTRFDASFSARTRNDILNAAFANDEDLDGLPKNIVRTAASAVAMIEFGINCSNKQSHYEKAAAALKHKEFIVWAARTLQEKRKCCRVGVLFAAYVTFKQSPCHATRFWNEVQEGSNIDPMSGTRALQRILIEYGAGSGATRIGAVSS